MTTDQSEPAATFPFWAGVADSLVLFLLTFAASVAIFGGIRTQVGGMRVSISSPGRLLIAAAVLAVLRHALVRHDPIVVRVPRQVKLLRRSPVLAAAAPVFFSTRLGVLMVGYLAVAMVGYGPKPPFRVSANEFLNLPARWDSGWYLGIATEGYVWNPNVERQQNIAFFPAFPTLMRTAGLALGARRRAGYEVTMLLAGLLVSLVSFAWALAYLFRLAREDLGDDERAAGALVLLASYPFAVFFSAAYTESLFLLGTVGAFYHLRSNEPARAAGWGLLVGLTRPNGFLLSVPLALLALESIWPRLSDLRRAPRSGTVASTTGVLQRLTTNRALVLIGAAAAPGVGMLLFSGFIYRLTGRPFTWAEVHGAWGRTYRGLGVLITERVEYLSANGLYNYTSVLAGDMLNTLAALFGLALVWPILRRFGFPYAALVVVNLLPPLAAGGTLSMGRMTAVLFPLFFWLAAVIPTQHRPAWTTAFALVQGLIATLFFTWRPMF